MSNTERAPEPTMDEILASIRRIIAEDDAPDTAPEAEAEVSEGALEEDVFELSADQITDPRADEEPEPLDLVDEVPLDEGASDAPEPPVEAATDDVDEALPLDVGQIVEDRIDEGPADQDAPSDLDSLMEAVADREPEQDDQPGFAGAQDDPSHDALSSVDQLLAELKQRQSEAEAEMEGGPSTGDTEPEFAVEVREEESLETESASLVDIAPDADQPEAVDDRDEGDIAAADETAGEGRGGTFEDPLEAALADLAAGLEEVDVVADDAPPEEEMEAAPEHEPDADDELREHEAPPAAEDVEGLEDLPAPVEFLDDEDQPASEGAEVLEELSAIDELRDHEDPPAAEGLGEPEDLGADDEFGETEDQPAAEGAEEPEELHSADEFGDAGDQPVAEGAEEPEELHAADEFGEPEDQPAAESGEPLEELSADEILRDLEDMAAAEDPGDIEGTPDAEPQTGYEPPEPQRIVATPIAAAAVAAAASAAGNGMAEQASQSQEGGTPHAPTLEDSVKELLRPMLQQWLDQNMPQIVESVVKEQLSATDQSDEAS